MKAGETKEKSMSCAEFQHELPFLMEGDGSAVTEHPHLRDCHQCSDLVRDLRYIADQAKLLLPMHDPSPRVWGNIQSALKNDGYAEKEDRRQGQEVARGPNEDWTNLGLAVAIALILLITFAMFRS